MIMVAETSLIASQETMASSQTEYGRSHDDCWCCSSIGTAHGPDSANRGPKDVMYKSSKPSQLVHKPIVCCRHDVTAMQNWETHVQYLTTHKHFCTKCDQASKNCNNSWTRINNTCNNPCTTCTHPDVKCTVCTYNEEPLKETFISHNSPLLICDKISWPTVSKDVLTNRRLPLNSFIHPGSHVVLLRHRSYFHRCLTAVVVLLLFLNVTSAQGDNPCDVVPVHPARQVFGRHPSNCSIFYMCYGPQHWQLTCTQNNTVFSLTHSVCVWMGSKFDDCSPSLGQVILTRNEYEKLERFVHLHPNDESSDLKTSDQLLALQLKPPSLRTGDKPETHLPAVSSMVSNFDGETARERTYSFRQHGPFPVLQLLRGYDVWYPASQGTVTTFDRSGVQNNPTTRISGDEVATSSGNSEVKEETVSDDLNSNEKEEELPRLQWTTGQSSDLTSQSTQSGDDIWYPPVFPPQPTETGVITDEVSSSDLDTAAMDITAEEPSPPESKNVPPQENWSPTTDPHSNQTFDDDKLDVDAILTATDNTQETILGQQLFQAFNYRDKYIKDRWPDFSLSGTRYLYPQWTRMTQVPGSHDVTTSDPPQSNSQHYDVLNPSYADITNKVKPTKENNTEEILGARELSQSQSVDGDYLSEYNDIGLDWRRQQIRKPHKSFRNEFTPEDPRSPPRETVKVRPFTFGLGISWLLPGSTSSAPRDILSETTRFQKRFQGTHQTHDMPLLPVWRTHEHGAFFNTSTGIQGSRPPKLIGHYKYSDHQHNKESFYSNQELTNSYSHMRYLPYFTKPSISIQPYTPDGNSFKRAITSDQRTDKGYVKNTRHVTSRPNYRIPPISAMIDEPNHFPFGRPWQRFQASILRPSVPTTLATRRPTSQRATDNPKLMENFLRFLNLSVHGKDRVRVHQSQNTRTQNFPPQKRDQKYQTNIRNTQRNVKPTQTNIRNIQRNVKPTQTNINVRHTQTKTRSTQSHMRPTIAYPRPTHRLVRPTKSNIRPTQDNFRPTQTKILPTQSYRHLKQNNMQNTERTTRRHQQTSRHPFKPETRARPLIQTPTWYTRNDPTPRPLAEKTISTKDKIRPWLRTTARPSQRAPQSSRHKETSRAFQESSQLKFNFKQLEERKRQLALQKQEVILNKQPQPNNQQRQKPNRQHRQQLPNHQQVQNAHPPKTTDINKPRNAPNTIPTNSLPDLNSWQNGPLKPQGMIPTEPSLPKVNQRPNSTQIPYIKRTNFWYTGPTPSTKSPNLTYGHREKWSSYKDGTDRRREPSILPKPKQKAGNIAKDKLTLQNRKQQWLDSRRRDVINSWQIVVKPKETKGQNTVDSEGSYWWNVDGKHVQHVTTPRPSTPTAATTSTTSTAIPTTTETTTPSTTTEPTTPTTEASITTTITTNEVTTTPPLTASANSTTTAVIPATTGTDFRSRKIPPFVGPDYVPDYRRDMQDKCGVLARPLIIGGRKSRSGQWPWQVSLQIITSTTPWHRCGGVLVHERWVLTAAHCVEGSFYGDIRNWRVVMADYDLDTVSGNEIYRDVVRVISHPDYVRTSNFPNDVALLELDLPVDLTSGDVQTACLPDRSMQLGAGTHCWISGWGETRGTGGTENTMNEVPVDVVANEECAEMWGKVNIDVLETQVCLGYGDTGACYGDSGGPLMCEDQGRFYVAGVMSWLINNCSATNFPNVFTRLPNYMDWVYEHLDYFEWLRYL